MMRSAVFSPWLELMCGTNYTDSDNVRLFLERRCMFRLCQQMRCCAEVRTVRSHVVQQDVVHIKNL